ncbi:MAG TPA: NAD(P)-binding domain-containing protein [Solirubrobacteraceae bacterium]|nr:NAD(P)-binding domain-containing protein [Solirubrobacteraceae bacterium]
MMRTDTVIIGAGQAGLALSLELRAAGHEHVVLERGRVGERWRSERWDSLHLLTPNWLNQLPGTAPLPDPHGYLDRRGVVGYLEAYAAGAPVRERTTVSRVRRAGRGFHIETDRGHWQAANVVIATGDCDVPRLPTAAAGAPASVHSLHAAHYRRPDQLPPGAVLVVGAGPSGQQLAGELRAAGRAVTLAVGRHTRMPRRYRGRDVFDWLHATGRLTTPAGAVPDLEAARRAPGFPVSGSGETLGLDRLAAQGVVVTGRLEGFAGRYALFGSHLQHELREADRRQRRVLADIDAHIAQTGAAAEPEPWPAPVMLARGPERLDLGAVGTVLWATGYTRAYPWLEVPVLDHCGQLVHREGVTAAPGLYALGLRFQRTRRSHLLGGVGEDAEFIAGRILAGAPTERLARPA